MQVFISWSGQLSKDLGKAIYEWLPNVLQAVEPFFSPDEIDKGGRWASEISRKLEELKIGIFCLTPDNLNSAWMLFEAGAISKVVGESYVCPILFKLEPAQIKQPMAQFQMTKYEKEDMRKLLNTINSQTDRPLHDLKLNEAFDLWWDKLDKKITEIFSMNKATSLEKARDSKDILEEILSLTRLISKRQEEYKVRRFSKAPHPGLKSANDKKIAIPFMPLFSPGKSPDSKVEAYGINRSDLREILRETIKMLKLEKENNGLESQ